MHGYISFNPFDFPDLTRDQLERALDQCYGRSNYKVYTQIEPNCLDERVTVEIKGNSRSQIDRLNAGKYVLPIRWGGATYPTQSKPVSQPVTRGSHNNRSKLLLV